MRKEAHAGEDSPRVPSDAAAFGFVVRGHIGDVARLEATRAFRIALANGPVHGSPPAAFENASAIVSRELARYPASFLREIRLGGVVFGDELRENEMAIPSLPNVGGLLLLDASASPVDLVRTLHHEVFHFFDLVDDGRVSPDPGWEALNAPGFAYGSGGRTLRGRWAAQPSSDLLGFVSGYATSGAEEDKAETFAFAMARTKDLAERAVSDGVVRAKIGEIARRLDAFQPETSQRLGLHSLARGR